ncbi:TMEM175 family protein [Actinomycetospora flava]|uniref:TMEM175 family protein n=1 Tax=Actinomycetospora flava TaxID=3129232 RepID=A0ABU8MF05_9PSEU
MDEIGSRDVEPAGESDNSLGRLLALSDGVFAISMTLLALDLRVPDLATPDNASLAQALVTLVPNFLSYAVSFYVIASYWLCHRQLMRSVTSSHPQLLSRTLPLLLMVAVLPFPASLLGHYGREPIALAVYGVVNAVIVVLLLRLRHLIDTRGLVTSTPKDRDRMVWPLVGNLVVFLLCIPAGWVLGSQGPWVLALLVVSDRLGAMRLWWLGRRPQAAP